MRYERHIGSPITLPDLAGTLKHWARRTRCKTRGMPDNCCPSLRAACLMLSPIIDHQSIHFILCFGRGCGEQRTQPYGNIESYKPRIPTSIRLYSLADFPRNYLVIQSPAKEGSSQWCGIGPCAGRSCSGTFSHRTHMYNIRHLSLNEISDPAGCQLRLQNFPDDLHVS